MSIKFTHTSGAQVETTEEYADMYRSQGWTEVEAPKPPAPKSAPAPKSDED